MSLERMSNDQLHNQRKQIECNLKEGIFTKDQMNQHDCRDDDQRVKRVADYDRWKQSSNNGVTKETQMAQFGEINREFKRRGEEGRVHSMDDLRNRKSVKYD